MKNVHPHTLLKILSILAILLGGLLFLTEGIGLLLPSVKTVVPPLCDLLFLILGVFGIRNYNIPGKEPTLVRMSRIAFLAAIAAAAVRVSSVLSWIKAGIFLPLYVFHMLTFALPVLAALYWFAARRNLKEKEYR